jgi:hypothetical protein
LVVAGFCGGLTVLFAPLVSSRECVLIDVFVYIEKLLFHKCYLSS